MGSDERATSGDERRKPFWREFPVLLVVAFLVALLMKAFLVQAFYIPSESMEPTLVRGDRVLVEKLSYRFGEPERGDVIVFERDVSEGVARDDADDTDDRGVLGRIGDSVRELFGFPTGGKQDYIKRVIALPGETVEGRGGRVLVDGTALDEPYLAEGTIINDFPSFELPANNYWVMGDNRTHSDDSRNNGPVKASQIVGRAFVLIWPPGEMGGL